MESLPNTDISLNMLHTKRTCKHIRLQISTIVTKTLGLTSSKLANNHIPHLLNLHQ